MEDRSPTLMTTCLDGVDVEDMPDILEILDDLFETLVNSDFDPVYMALVITRYKNQVYSCKIL